MVPQTQVMIGLKSVTVYEALGGKATRGRPFMSRQMIVDMVLSAELLDRAASKASCHQILRRLIDIKESEASSHH